MSTLLLLGTLLIVTNGMLFIGILRLKDEVDELRNLVVILETRRMYDRRQP